MLASRFPSKLRFALTRACFNLHVPGCDNSSRRQFSFKAYVERAASTGVDFAPVLCVQNALVDFHTSFGMPWCADIVAITVLTKLLVSLPLGVARERTLAKYNIVSLEMKDHAVNIGESLILKEMSGELTEAECAKKYKYQVKKKKQSLLEERNCRPSRGILIGLLDVPFWICFFLSLRNLAIAFPDEQALIAKEQLSREGMLWFPDLTIPDTPVLPFVVGLTAVAHTGYYWLQRRQNNIPATAFMTGLTIFGITLAPVLTWACFYVPSNISLYWLMSGLMNLVQVVLLSYPSIRTFFRIPLTGKEMKPLKLHFLSGGRSLSK